MFMGHQIFINPEIRTVFGERRTKKLFFCPDTCWLTPLMEGSYYKNWVLRVIIGKILISEKSVGNTVSCFF